MRRDFRLIVALACMVAPFGSAALAADLGKSLGGDSCRSAPSESSDAPTLIQCNNDTAADGSVALIHPGQPLAQGAEQRRSAILALPAMRSGDDALDCSAGDWLAKASILLRSCTLKANGWPRIVVVVDEGGEVVRAEGAPALLPVLATAIAAAAPPGLSPEQSGVLEKAVAAKFSSGVLHASQSDYDRYRKLIEDGRLAGAHDNYAAAESDYREALGIEEKLFGPDAMLVGETLAELALQVSNQGRFGEAAALFARARPIIEASASPDARAKLDSYMALDAANARNYSTALAYAADAAAERQAQFESSGGSDAASDNGQLEPGLVSRGELSHSLRIEAEMALRVGDFARARASAEEALWIVSEEPGLPLWWRPETIALMGEVNEAQGRVVQAEHDFVDARKLDSQLFGDSAPTAVADFALAEFYTRQQLYPSALDAFHAGFAIAQKDATTRNEISNDAVAQFITATAGANAKENEDKRDAEIFDAAQYPRTGVADRAIDRIAARDAAANAGLSDLVGQFQRAEQDRDQAEVALAAEYAKMDEERDAVREQQLAGNVRLASNTADGLLAKVKAQFPKYLDMAEPAPAGLKDVQAKLAPDEALVAYVIGTNSGYALVVRNKSFAAVALPAGKASLAADIADLRHMLTPRLGRAGDFSLKNSYALYRQLVAPLDAQLAGATHVLVVPGDTVSALPLALLDATPPAGRNGEHDYAHADWLARHFAFSELPSVQAFVALRTAASENARQPRFLGLAPEFRGAPAEKGGNALAELTDSCRENGPVSADMLRALPALPDTAAEVRSVAADLGYPEPTLLLGSEATETNFRAQPLEQYSVVYFATHGVLPGELRCSGEPALVLSPPQEPAATTNDDGLLNASEIARLSLRADLVVLSGCNTAADAKTLGDDALEGLSDAFFLSGARAVLASHWTVSSSSTVALMTRLFARAGEGAGTADALRDAELSLIARPATANPFYWAAFTLIGDGGQALGKRSTVLEAQFTTGTRP